MVVVTGLEPRRRGLRIVRVRALKIRLAHTLTHSAAPPSPQKTSFFGGPFLPEVTGSASFTKQKKQTERSASFPGGRYRT